MQNNSFIQVFLDCNTDICQIIKRQTFEVKFKTGLIIHEI